jgi:hypothetical protein
MVLAPILAIAAVVALFAIMVRLTRIVSALNDIHNELVDFNDAQKQKDAAVVEVERHANGVCAV